LREGKGLGGGLLLEEVVDELHDVEAAGGEQGVELVLVVVGRGDAVGADLALLFEAFEDGERGGVAVPGAGPDSSRLARRWDSG
jgi:hypothetical protein